MPDFPTIDVIVPIYRGLKETQRCINSVLASKSSMSFELVLVDDASPEPAIICYLDTLVASGRVTLLRNEYNIGFVQTVNRGMALHPDRDVVLLNSDTEVANDWIDRLKRCAYLANDIGTVTPFSNNATICSYPFEGWHGGVPGNLGLAGLDRLFAQTNRALAVELPTAVGFCMYIRRACLEEVGPFDAERFGRGYGEENDFCLRASAVGWRHLLAANVFVFHEGGVSFAGERVKLQESAMKALLEAHPDYLERINEFHSRDPAAELRDAVDRARMATCTEERRHVFAEQLSRNDPTNSLLQVRLHITHSWGGGTSRWVRDYCQADIGCRNLVLQSRTERNHTGRWLELIEPRRGEAPLMSWELSTPIDASAISHTEYLAILDGIVGTFGVGSLVVSSLIGHSLAALDTELPTVVVWHDLYPFCPALFAFFDVPCDSCSADRLQSCLRTNPNNVFWHNTLAEAWLTLREVYAVKLRQPWIRLAAPTHSVWERWTGLLPLLRDLPWSRIGHGIDRKELGPQLAAVTEVSHRLRIVVPGRLSPHKGLFLLRQAITELTQYADILLLGCGDFGASFANNPGVIVVSNYELLELGAEIRSFQPDVALLLSVLPESFSYTLSEMFALGVPVVATRLGAFSERIEDGVTGFLVDPTPEALIARIRELSIDRRALSDIRQYVTTLPEYDLYDMVAEYRALLSDAPIVRLRSFSDYGLTQAVVKRIELERLIAQTRSEHHASLGCAATLEAEIADWNTRGAELSRLLDAKTRECDIMLRSRSWAVTAPLRTAMSAVRRLFSAMKSEYGTCAVPAKATPAENTSAVFISGPDITLSQQVSRWTSPNAARGDMRYALGLPDAARIVLTSWSSGILTDDLANTILACVRLRNDVCFLIPEMDLNTLPSGWHRDALGLLVSTRRLFVDRSRGSIDDCFLAADALLVSDEEVDSETRRGTALRAGLLTLVLAERVSPTVPRNNLAALVTFSSPEQGAQALSRWLDYPDTERKRMAAATLAQLVQEK